MQEVLVKIKRGVNFALSRLAALLLITMTILVLYQVFTRYVLGSPADFTEEVVRYLLMWTGFVGAAYAFSTREHMALVFLRDKMSPRNKMVLMVAMDALILLFVLFVMVIGGFKLAMSARKVYSALLGIPRSLVYGMTPVSGVFILLIQVINIWEDITGVKIAEGEEA